MAKTIRLRKEPRDVVVITGNDGGFLSGKCFACGQSGWLEGYGYPSHINTDEINKGWHLKHKKSCPMNAVVDDNGDLKPGYRKRGD